ncbi:MAG: bifunctional tetrahydrofolate synthase/dihydrofolate synthase [Marinospirillum sp.]|uniref:bifunctional tetrahydrofolate synthase/dihydrofolate synthase n=1 Tax=Marinospirillum sp. TaxID=2183934 RepID=UPI0019E687E9|nr:bifunctional tetrahydrofolate synthase/dihydrofolate synthase [Marinospirillum sp.]MBE0507514.1 bifunctional tetrahydrofolate synthase/dihydrofolate synthase [Marinospirillum sp.]
MTSEHLPDSSGTLDTWLKHLETLHSREIDLGLERVKAIALRLNLPLTAASRSCRVITFAGTNGKGSTLAMTQAMALAAGLTVGSYTSPHFLHFNERIQINGRPVSDAAIIHAFERIEAARCQPPEQTLTLSYFEFATLAGLLLFQDAGLELWLLEVGLGGRLDAVNIVDCDVAVLTTVALDHQDYLGDTLELIGAEKAGIFRSGCPAVLGSEQLPDSVKKAAAKLGADVFQLGEHYFRSLPQQGYWHWRGQDKQHQPLYLNNLPVNSLPDDNAATAVQALLLACQDIKCQAIADGLATAQLTGRMQRIPANAGYWLLDVAHNPEAAEYLAKQLQQQGEVRRVALVGMMADKDMAATLKPLLPLVDGWITTALPLPRAAKPEKLALLLQEMGAEVLAVCDDAEVQQAYKTALAQLNAGCEEILVMGSFFTLAGILEIMQKSEAQSCGTE